MFKTKIFKIFERRDLWTIQVLRLESLDSFFKNNKFSQIKHVGETGLRTTRRYQSTVADPFLFVHKNRLYLFYEVKTDHSHGVIHAKSMDSAGIWRSHGLVLSQPFHLSYPQVFSTGNKIYMIPESAQAGKVFLYEAKDFPNDWRLSATLIDAPLRDPTLLIAQSGEFFIMGTTPNYELKLYHSSTYNGHFRDTGIEITRDLKYSRCAGGVVKIDDILLRPAQDCSENYGKRISFHEIKEISNSNYSESIINYSIDSLTNGLRNARGFHHISFAEFDGCNFVAVDIRSADSIINSFCLGFFRASEKFYLKNVFKKFNHACSNE